MQRLALLLSGLGLVSLGVQAGPVSDVTVKDNAVVFSTTDMTDSNVACVTSENKKLRAFSLNTHQGRAMYSLLITALTKGHGIEVQEAQDCADLPTVQRAQSIRLLADVNSGSDSKSIGLYKSDGVSRIGTFIKFEKVAKASGEQYIWTYLDSEAGIDYKTITINPPQSKETFYADYRCRGEELAPYQGTWYHDGKFFKTSSMKKVKSKFSSVCSENIDFLNMSGWSFEVTEHPVCGAGLCTIRED